MSKNKDIEKPNIEKHKDFKIEKIEKPELKEKPEKREHKEIKEPWKEKLEKFEQKETKELKQEHKEKPERKEFKEPIKEKFENKEIKELEKQVFEKGGKEIAENIDLGGEVLNPRAAAFGGGEAFTEAFSDMSAATAAKPKETDKAPVKDIEKVKPEKEQVEKIQKDIEKVKPEKEHFKHELKDHKIEKIEHKEFKFEKHEIKDLKIEITEKLHQKDFLPDKQVFENDPKGIVENPQGGPVFDPANRGPLFAATGTPAERLQELEDAVTKLSHFIGVDLRPDLSGGALKGEPDVAGGGGTGDTKTEDKGKKPGGR
jgi:hypothetical protein